MTSIYNDHFCADRQILKLLMYKLYRYRTQIRKEKFWHLKYLNNNSCCSIPLWPERSTIFNPSCDSVNGQATMIRWILIVSMNECSRSSWVLKSIKTNSLLWKNFVFNRDHERNHCRKKIINHLNHDWSRCSLIISFNPWVYIIHAKYWVNLPSF